MTEVFVPNGDNAQETATLLLAAAEKAGEDPSVVRSSSDGGFYAPEDIAKKAKVDYEEDDESDEEPAEEPKPAKKAAAKKAASK
jgi:hypothetical protein